MRRGSTILEDSLSLELLAGLVRARRFDHLWPFGEKSVAIGLGTSRHVPPCLRLF